MVFKHTHGNLCMTGAGIVTWCAKLCMATATISFILEELNSNMHSNVPAAFGRDPFTYPPEFSELYFRGAHWDSINLNREASTRRCCEDGQGSRVRHVWRYHPGNAALPCGRLLLSSTLSICVAGMCAFQTVGKM